MMRQSKFQIEWIKWEEVGDCDINNLTRDMAVVSGIPYLVERDYVLDEYELFYLPREFSEGDYNYSYPSRFKGNWIYVGCGLNKEDNVNEIVESHFTSNFIKEYSRELKCH